MTFRKCLIFILGFAGAVVPGRASLSFYTNSSQSAFNSAISGVTPTTIDLLTLTTTSGGLLDTATGLTFQDQNGAASELSVLSSCTSTCTDGGLKTISGFEINIVVPATYTAISFQILNSGSPGASISVNATRFTSYSGLTASSSTFIGAVDASGISGLYITGNSGSFEIDNVTAYSQTTGGAVAERSTFFLFGGGLILLGLLGRFQRASTLS